MTENKDTLDSFNEKIEEINNFNMIKRMDEYNLVKYQRIEPLEVVTQRIERVHEILKHQMHEDIHYGIIQGTDKKSLWKAGAELISMNFSLRPSYEKEIRLFENFHREYIVKCKLYKMLDMHTFCLVGEAEGSCSTLESKFRYRYEEGKLSDTLVPKQYWDLRNSKNDSDISKAKKMVPDWAWKPAKDEKTGKWFWMEKSNKRIENPDIADQWNTVLKIALKRAYVSAVVTFCAASNIFIPITDINDLSDEKVQDTSYIDMKIPEPSPEQSQNPGWFIEQTKTIQDHDILFEFLEQNSFSFQFFEENEQENIYKTFADAVCRLFDNAKNARDLESIAKRFSNLSSMKKYSVQLNQSYNNKKKGFKS